MLEIFTAGLTYTATISQWIAAAIILRFVFFYSVRSFLQFLQAWHMSSVHPLSLFVPRKTNAQVQVFQVTNCHKPG